jgi:secreted protein with Ig-like and vWFA domain
MKIDANDPRWTAYALGELDDEKDRAEIEAVLQESNEARGLVEEIRSSAQWLADGLQMEPAIGLSSPQKQKIESRIGGKHLWFGFQFDQMIAGAALVAAVLVIVLVGAPFVKRTMKTGSEQSPIAKISVPSLTRSVESQAVKPASEPVPIQTAGTRPQASLPGNAAVGGPPPASRPLQSRNEPMPAQPLLIERPTIANISPASGQVVTTAPGFASLSGAVVDPSGAVIPGAEITARNQATGSEFKAVTAENGSFHFPVMGTGTYSATIKMPGFKQADVKDILLQAGLANNIKVKMDIGGVGEVVTVTAGFERVQSQSATVMSSLSKQATQLPTRNALDFLAMMPGTNRASNIGGPTLPGNVVIDGISTTQKDKKGGDGFYSQISPRLDAIQEVTVSSAAPGTEAYKPIKDNAYQDVAQKPLSTFSIDVDTASYSNMRRFLNNGQLPPQASVRIEEWINYFDYEYPGPNDGRPFAANFEVTEAPWNPVHRLLRIGLKARELRGERPAGNLVFLIDVSGSMGDANKLSLVKESMRLLVSQLTENDRVAIVVYATEARRVLPPTRGDQKQRILEAINSLEASGTTNGAAGIQLAYQAAEEGFLRKGVNRVILATDGDFNVGIINRSDLTRLIEVKRTSGIFLSALGFGMGNLKDATLEMLADKGNGNYAYIDTLQEARKVLVAQLDATLVPVAKDVKVQIEFNPAFVGAYRLIGYEDRLLHREDFNNDAKDAGEMGAGHSVTVLYELVPALQNAVEPSVDPLKYQRPIITATPAARSDELLTMKIRYKEPNQDESNLLEYVARDPGKPFSAASRDFKFAAAVAAFGMWLRDSPYQGRMTFEDIQQWARMGQGYDPYGYRQEFLLLISRAVNLKK